MRRFEMFTFCLISSSDFFLGLKRFRGFRFPSLWLERSGM